MFIFLYTGQLTSILPYCDKDDTKELSELLLNCADPNEAWSNGWSCLHRAAFKGKLNVVKLLLSYNADPNLQQFIHKKTPLHDAAFNGDRDVVEALLDAGARTDIVNKAGFTPAGMARRAGEETLADFIDSFQLDETSKLAKEVS